MSKKHLTLQTSLAIAILLIGVIGIALVISTDYTYRRLAFEQQQESVNQLIAIKSADLLKKLTSLQQDLGFKLQNDENFKTALQDKNKKDITYWLDQEFNRYYVTIGLIKLEKILIYDENFQLLASSKHGIKITDINHPPCSQPIRKIKSLPTIDRIKPHSQLCEYNTQVLHSTVVSVGSIRPEGYIQIIAEPTHILAQIESELGIPVTIYDGHQQLLQQSFNWPKANLEDDYLISTHTVSDSSNDQSSNVELQINAASDIKAFKHRLDNTRYQIIIGSSVLTLLTLLIALSLLHRGLLPLKKLRLAANSSARGEFVPVDEDAYTEIRTPLHAFNLMVNKIQSLIADLTSEVEEHKKTEKKLELAKNTAEQHAQQAEDQRNFLRMTLQSIVDGVITTTIDGHVKSINPIAEQLTGWTEEEARGKPLVQIMQALDEVTRKRIENPAENIEDKTVLDESISAILIQNHSGIETPVEYIVAPMRDTRDEIAGIVIIIHDESIQRNLNRQLTFQATHDALTGLINRYEFERRLKNIISMQVIEKSTNTLCYIDLDQFKLINDTCGHTAGDKLLKQITALLENNLSGTGTLARLGGDEFGLLLENIDIHKAEIIVGRLLILIQQTPFTWNESTFTIGASIGIAPVTRSTLSCEEVLSNADSACYLAKENGRNRILVFTDEDDKLLTQQREMHWVSRINHALEENRFQLYFQEIMPLGGQDKSFLLHGEILLRMIDKEGDIISPSSFLPAAERYNMITLIDKWVVEKSIIWLAERKAKVLISINLSGMSLSNRDFLNFVVSKIKQHEINPELLCFEITETAAINHMQTAIHFMNVLKKLGCAFALDDFGKGLSSFSYLTSLPVDYLKIDGTFVMDIDKDPMHYAMVKSINEVGQVMGIKTIAEFAASEDIVNCLRDIGVDNAQGYAVARPVPLISVVPENSKPVLTAVKSDS